MVIDPSFYVPPEMIGDEFIYAVRDYDAEQLDETDVFSDYGQDDFDSDTESYTLQAPDFSILNQTVHISPDGTSVVDVVIDVDDVPGATDYDIRVTKI